MTKNRRQNKNEFFLKPFSRFRHLWLCSLLWLGENHPKQHRLEASENQGNISLHKSPRDGKHNKVLLLEPSRPGEVTGLKTACFTSNHRCCPPLDGTCPRLFAPLLLRQARGWSPLWGKGGWGKLPSSQGYFLSNDNNTGNGGEWDPHGACLHNYARTHTRLQGDNDKHWLQGQTPLNDDIL